MYRKRTLVALLLALMLIFALALPASADYDYAANAKVFESDYTGKTVILHTNDIHGRFDGYPAVAAARTAFEKAGAEVILVDAGDFSQGTPYVYSSQGASAVTMMNAAGYDIVTLGNHDFDFGYLQLKENLKAAGFKVICANVYLDASGETVFDPCAVYETKSGMKLGFFGIVTPETVTKTNPIFTRDISFASYDELYASAQLAVDKLKENRADLIIGLTHLGVDEESAVLGYRSIDLYNKVTDIDFLIDGHSHTVMTAGENGEPIQSTGSYSANIGVVVINNDSREIEDHFLIGIPGYPVDETVAAAEKEITDLVDAEYNAVFARTEVALNGKREDNRTRETNLGKLITDAMVWTVESNGSLDATPEYRGAPVVGILNGGGIRASIPVGDLTKSDVNTVLPFGNTVAVVYVTGEELLEALEASTYCTPEQLAGYPQTCGMEWTVDTTKEFDQGELYSLYGKESSYYAPASIRRISIQTVGGEPFDESATYAVVTSNFCAAGGDTYSVFHRAYSQGCGFDTGIGLDEALMRYITDVLGGVIGKEASSDSAPALSAEPDGSTGKRVYFAAPMFSHSEKEFNERLTKVLEDNGYEVFLPQRDGIEAALLEGKTEEEMTEMIFDLDSSEVLKADIVFVVLDGRVPDEGACVELGIGYASGKRCYGVKTDTRSVESNMDVNPMITGCLTKLFKDYDGDSLIKALEQYLSENEL